MHCDAPSDEETDWSQILALYDTLVPLLPTTAVAVNRAVVLGKVEGPESALAALESVVAADAAAGRDHYLLAVRADLLEASGRHTEAAELFEQAARATENDAERDHPLARADAIRTS